MDSTQSTCWELIEAAARGEPDSQQQFAALYGGLVRSFLAGIWRGTPHNHSVDDAAQDVFVECLKAGGALGRADRGRPEGFRAFLQGVVRNVARRHEMGLARLRQGSDGQDGASQVADGGPSPSRALDREWALTVVREAAQRMADRAAGLGPAARRRVELLRLRFHEDRPIRTIAEEWALEADYLHHQYAKARREFRDMLESIVAQHFPGSKDEVQRECARLIDFLD